MIMAHELHPAGEFVTVSGHKMHVYRDGNTRGPKLVFLSGSATVAPVYDFKILYRKLLRDFRVIVIEKFGYGYSEHYEAPCDIDSLVSYLRQALEQLGESGPFILLPHSMSGLEAIRWKQKYPEEIRAIIGLDMAVPAQYLDWGQEGLNKRVGQMIRLQKLHKKGLLFWYPMNKRGLEQEDIEQQKLLRKRNMMDDCMIREGRAVLNNAKIVDQGGQIDGPIRLFVSDGKQVSAHWIRYQKEFAKRNKARIILLSCGHYVHYYESERIAKEIKEFAK